MTVLTSGPTVVLLIDEPNFRLARVEISDHVEHVLEVRDGCDVLGVERWRKFEIGSNSTIRALFHYLVQFAERERELHAKNI